MKKYESYKDSGVGCIGEIPRQWSCVKVTHLLRERVDKSEDGIGEPYSSQVNLLTGEIGDDLTYYFATSEQTPSAVGLGVLVDTDETVKDAGGFIIQLMPDVLEEEITALEEALKNAAPISEMIDQGMTPEDILTKIIGNMGFELLEGVTASVTAPDGTNLAMDDSELNVPMVLRL